MHNETNIKCANRKHQREKLNIEKLDKYTVLLLNLDVDM